MKILDYGKFVSEKMKIIPISNDELNNINSFNYKMEKINDPKYDDLLISGRIVELKIKNKIHHGITMRIDEFKKISDCFENYDDCYVIAVLDDTDKLLYWKTNLFNEKFPYNAIFSYVKIKNVFKTNIDVSELTKNRVKHIYEFLNLKKYINN